jgi:peptide/nickel transport system permease protein
MAFLLLRVIPGDPALVKLAGETGESSFTQAQLEALQAKLGTDRPLYAQYAKWVWGMLRLDFGESMFFEEPVAKDLVDKFPITLELTVLALLIATIVAVPLGLLSAIKQDTPADYIARIISITGVALPIFWVGILIVYFLVLFSLGCRRWATPTCGRIQ